MKYPRVLVVDDDSSLLELMATRVQRLGLKADRAGDGRAALVMINRTEYDLIVADIYMPEASGLDILREAKARDPNVQVIIVTAAATLDNAVKALNDGAFNYLTKPFEHLSVFDRAVSQALEFRRLILDNIRLVEIQRRRGDMLEAEVADRIQQLRRSLRELPDLLAHFPDGVLIVDPAGKILMSNPAAERWLAVEMRSAESPIQKYLRVLRENWVPFSDYVAVGARTVRLSSADLSAEDDKKRMVVFIQDVGALAEGINRSSMKPLATLKRGLAWLYQQRPEELTAEVIKHLAHQVALLERLPERLAQPEFRPSTRSVQPSESKPLAPTDGLEVVDEEMLKRGSNVTS